MSAITKQWLQQTIAEYEDNRDELPFGLDTNSAIELQAFKLALASLEAEPVGEVSEQRDGLVMDGTVDLGGASTHRIIKGASKMKRLPLGTKFYTAPPAPVSVPDAMEMDDDFDSAFEHGKAVGWNAYRAAMLQSFGNSEQLNSPVIPDGWVACSERMPAGNCEDRKRYDVIDDDDDVILSAITYNEAQAATDGYNDHGGNFHIVEHDAAPKSEVKP